MANISESTNIVVLNGDTNADGLVNAKDLEQCPINAIGDYINALPSDQTISSVISGFTAGANPGEYIVTLTESDGSTSTATLTVPGSTFDGTTITLSDGTTFTPSPDDDITAVIGSQVNANGEATVVVEEGSTSFTGTITCVMQRPKGVFDSAGEQIPWPDIKTTGLQEFERRCCARFRQVVSLTDGLVRTVVSPFNPATGSGVFKWTDPITGWSAELAVTGAGSYNGPSGTTTNQTFTQMTDGTVDLSVVDAGDKLARTGWPHQIRRQQLIVADLDIGEATLTNSIGTVTNIGDFTEAPPGTFVTNPANDDSNLRFIDTNQPGGLLGTLSLVNVQLNQGDNWTVGVNLNYYPAAVIFKDCNGEIVRAEDEDGNEVDPALVEEVV